MKQTPHTSGWINICFLSSFAFAFVDALSNILYHAWDPPNMSDHIGVKILLFITGISFTLFLWSVLLTLIVRLYVTFKPSVYKMTSGLITTFRIIMVLILLVAL